MATTTNENQPGLVQRVTDFYHDVREEMTKVTWPTRQDLQVSTKVCMYMLGVMGAIVFIFDKVFLNAVLAIFSLVAPGGV